MQEVRHAAVRTSVRQAQESDDEARREQAERQKKIEEGISRTLAELCADDDRPLISGRQPLEMNIYPKEHTIEHANDMHRRSSPKDETTARPILIAMLAAVAVTLALLGAAYAQGYVP